MSEDGIEIVEEYVHDCRIVREKVEGAADRFHYEGPLGRVNNFGSAERARLFADVQTLTGGFREEKTGERGVPPAVAWARDDTIIAYLVSNETMGVERVARAFDMERGTVREYVEIVRKRAAEKRESAEKERPG